MIPAYKDCLKDMIVFCEQRGYSHEDFPAFARIFKSMEEIDTPIITPTRVKKLVANYYMLTANQLDGKTRIKAIRLPRQVAHYFSLLLTDATVERVGQVIGGKTHATVLNSKRKVEQLRDTKYPYGDYLHLTGVDELFAPYLLKKQQRADKHKQEQSNF